MECLATFLILLLAAMLAAGSATHSLANRSRRRFVYESLARRYAGSRVPGGLLRPMTLQLRYGDTRASLRETSHSWPYLQRCTELTIAWPDVEFRCEILPRKLVAHHQASSYVRELATGDAAFDAEFVVRGTNEKAVRQLVRDGVRWQVRRISQLFFSNSACVLIQFGQIIVRKPESLWKLDDLQLFVERSLELYDQIMLTRASGIEFLDGDEAQTLADVICPVCGETIARQLVFCRRCKTPHHADCWEFVGTCSVYGCGEKRCLYPQSARTANGSAAPPGHQGPGSGQSDHRIPPRQ